MRFKVMLTLSVCVALMVVIGLMGLRGLARLSTDMGSMYSASTVPIEDLAAMQAAALKIRLQMRYIQALHEQERAADLVADIGKEQKKLDVAWRDYYPAKIATTDERRLADRVARSWPPSGRNPTTSSRCFAPAIWTWEDVRRAIQRVVEINDSIFEASEEQRGGIGQVNDAVNRMDQVLRNNAAVVEQAAQAALSLEDQVAAQRCAIAVFEVRSQACGTAT
ncbi:MCP four helix bundle domain-containing protein [Paraburkholderia sp. 32]|uniref:MCP four helix bundle domain-containing protein n=1 Tax=unclassified Paraburkholderia TaxID=2615204 RepID=UPI003D1BE785